MNWPKQVVDVEVTPSVGTTRTWWLVCGTQRMDVSCVSTGNAGCTSHRVCDVEKGALLVDAGLPRVLVEAGVCTHAVCDQNTRMSEGKGYQSQAIKLAVLDGRRQAGAEKRKQHPNTCGSIVQHVSSETLSRTGLRAARTQVGNAEICWLHNATSQSISAKAHLRVEAPDLCACVLCAHQEQSVCAENHGIRQRQNNNDDSNDRPPCTAVGCVTSHTGSPCRSARNRTHARCTTEARVRTTNHVSRNKATCFG